MKAHSHDISQKTYYTGWVSLMPSAVARHASGLVGKVLGGAVVIRVLPRTASSHSVR